MDSWQWSKQGMMYDSCTCTYMYTVGYKKINYCNTCTCTVAS